MKSSTKDAQPSLTADELIIVWSSSRYKEPWDYAIWMASRNSVVEPFANITELTELNSGIGQSSPSIMPDGLIIYFTVTEDTQNIYKASRSSLNESFGDLIKLENISQPNKSNMHPYITPDEKRLYFWSDRGATGTGIWVSDYEEVFEPTEPELLAELNDEAGNKAMSPHLSSDRRTMYFARKIPGLADYCVVEAYRSGPSGPFTSERVAVELVVTGYNVSAPWLSQDGLRLYYHQFSSSYDAYIKMAQRANTSDPWTPVTTFTEIHAAGYGDALPSLTGDELIIFWHSNRPGSAGGIDIWTASRASTSEPFSNVTPLSELNTSVNDGGPRILPDGLTIFYSRGPEDGRTTSDIFKATRSSTSDPFSNIEIVEFPGYTSMWEQHPYVTPNEKEIYFETSQDGIWVVYWKNEFGDRCLPR